MIELLGPLLIALGSICSALSANLEHFFSPLEIEQEDIDDVENDHIRFSLQNVFKSANLESFKDPGWIESVQKYYNKNIKDLRDAEYYLRSLSHYARSLKMWIVILGVTFIGVGAVYTVSLTLDIFKDPETLIIAVDTFLVFSVISEIIFIVNCLRGYRKSKRELGEILKSQSLLLRGMFISGSGESEET